MSEPSDDDRLRTLAIAAQPGPWEPYVLGSEGYDVRMTVSAPGRLSRARIARFGYQDWDTDKANAHYIAALDPATVLALLDRLKRAETVLDPGSEGSL